MSAGPRRRLFIPEVVQTSMMDCGPAALKAILEGFGIAASYGRLREACQTEVDGTSIDTLEGIAVDLGLDAEQVMVPPDQVLLPDADALPCIAVIRLPNGFTHFIVVWRIFAGIVEIMDPVQGRRYLRADELTRQLYVHVMPVPASAFVEWASSEQNAKALRRRGSLIGCEPAVARALDEARQGGGWEPLAAVDAALRMTASVTRAGGVRRGSEAAAVFSSFLASAMATGEEAVPAAYWTARPAPPDEDGECVFLRGAVMVRIAGVKRAGRDDPAATTAPEDAAPESPLAADLAAVLNEKPTKPLDEVVRLAFGDGAQVAAAVVLVFALAAAATATVLEAVLLRGAFTVGRELGVVDQRLGAALALAVFLALMLLLDVPIAAGTLRLGRRLETRLRIAFLRKIPLLGDRYLASRPISDMANRSHDVLFLRQLPETLASCLRSLAAIVATTAGIAWLDRGSAPWAVLAALIAVLVPALAISPLAERDLRMRTHVGALGRFYLDALLGLVPIRTHGAERAVMREHEALLVEWARSAREVVRTYATADLIQSFVGVALALGLLTRYLAHGGDPTGVLLLVYWALALPLLGQELGALLRQYPTQRTTTLRMLEPLGAREEAEEGARSVASLEATRSRSSEIVFEAVAVRAGGHTILDEVDLTLRSGEHVAIVGASGAGKSSLVGVLLGWHRAARGRVLVDGRPLDGSELARLREKTAWVDPATHIWNRSVLDNVLYGAPPEGSRSLAGAIDTSELQSVLDKLPDGMQTSLGEGGGLVSGGEGQRVRLARSLLRRDARLVLLDEPFRGLDRERRHALLGRARDWWKEATLLCVTHDVSETNVFDRVIVVAEGRIVEDGSPAVLAADPSSKYRQMLDDEQRLLSEVWGGRGWRRLRLDAGQVLEGIPSISEARAAAAARAERGRS